MIGAGGIGFDVSEFLLKPVHQPQPQPLDDWQREWGIDPNPNYVSEGGLQPAQVEHPVREIYLLQRKTTALGIGLGKTSGWVHRAQLKNMQSKCYEVSNIKRLQMKVCGLKPMAMINFYG